MLSWKIYNNVFLTLKLAVDKLAERNGIYFGGKITLFKIFWLHILSIWNWDIFKLDLDILILLAYSCFI